MKTNWIILREFVVKDGEWKGKKAQEFHSKIGTLFVWPETESAELWVSNKLHNRESWDKLQKCERRPGSLPYKILTDLMGEIENAFDECSKVNHISTFSPQGERIET